MQRVSRDAVFAVLVGVAVGIVGAYAASASLAQFMFGVGVRSVLAYAGVSLWLVVIAAVAALWSARGVQRLPLAMLISAE